MGRLIVGIIIAFIGFVLVWKTEWFILNVGRIDWAEQHLGTEGGSRLAYKVLGTLIILAGLMYATDLSDNFMSWFVEGVFKTGKK
ncbi:hypothetical protein C4566_02255 [Candidatus Parcubacteria bacterium]|nr:MAG: hypothetical protein C4566_02255 [Candidatus Parcubacteria bacterium]